MRMVIYVSMGLIILGMSSLGARVFHGPYAGLHGVYHMNSLKSQIERASSINKIKTDSMSLGLHGGYARTFENRMFMALEFALSYDGISRMNKKYTVNQNGVPVQANVAINRMFGLGIDLRAGYNFERFFPGVVLYGGGTYAASRYRISGSLMDIGGTGKRTSRFLHGFGPVLGGEFRIKGPLVLGAAYKYYIYGRKKFMRMSIRPKVNSFMGYLSYHF